MPDPEKVQLSVEVGTPLRRNRSLSGALHSRKTFRAQRFRIPRGKSLLFARVRRNGRFQIKLESIDRLRPYEEQKPEIRRQPFALLFTGPKGCGDLPDRNYGILAENGESYGVFLKPWIGKRKSSATRPFSGSWLRPALIAKTFI